MKKQLLLLSILLSTALTQAQVSKSINLEAQGTLSQLLTAEEKKSVTQLILSGTYNYRDISTMKEMSQLTLIDLSSTTPGSHGLDFSYSTWHASIILPSHLQDIYLWNFQDCVNLTSIYLPKTVSNIDFFFSPKFYATINIDPENPYYTSTDGVVYNKDISQLFYCPKTKAGEFVIPPTVTQIRGAAICNNKNINSITLPQSLLKIDTCIIAGCPNLSDVRIYANTPPSDDYPFPSAFWSLPSSCKLHVPIGTLSAYANSEDWNYFTNIVEDLTYVSEQNLNINSNNTTPTSIAVKSNGNWNASSNESWLTITSSANTTLKTISINSSISGNGILTIIAQPNTTGISRTATISISENSTVTRTITVTQSGTLATYIELPVKQNFEIAPNPVTDKIHLNIGNENTVVEVVDLNGVIRISKEVRGDVDIDLNQLQSGIYLLNFKGQTTRFIKK